MGNYCLKAEQTHRLLFVPLWSHAIALRHTRHVAWRSERRSFKPFHLWLIPCKRLLPLRTTTWVIRSACDAIPQHKLILHFYTLDRTAIMQSGRKRRKCFLLFWLRITSIKIQYAAQFIASNILNKSNLNMRVCKACTFRHGLATWGANSKRSKINSHMDNTKLEYKNTFSCWKLFALF
jgi:hypothetical protein